MIKRKIDLGYKYEAGKGEGHSEPVGGIMHTKHEIQEGNMMAKKAIYKDLQALVESLGYVATPDIANRRSIICTTAAEIDAARNPLVNFFDAKGNWKWACMLRSTILILNH